MDWSWTQAFPCGFETLQKRLANDWGTYWDQNLLSDQKSRTEVLFKTPKTVVRDERWRFVCWKPEDFRGSRDSMLNWNSKCHSCNETQKTATWVGWERFKSISLLKSVLKYETKEVRCFREPVSVWIKSVQQPSSGPTKHPKQEKKDSRIWFPSRTLPALNPKRSRLQRFS